MCVKLFITWFICLLVMMSCKNSADWVPVYISTNTVDGGPGIYSLLFNTRTGKTKDLNVEVRGLKEPSFICFSPDKSTLYAYNSAGTGPAEIIAFRVDPQTRELKEINRVSTPTRSFCYIAAFDNGSYLGVASYGEGNAYSFSLNKDGSIGHRISFVQHEGKSIHSRQAGPHAHSMIQDPQRGEIYIPDLGIDQIMIYSLNEGKLDSLGYAGAEAGAGPRHLAFHKNGRYMAAVNEINNTVWIYERDSLGLFTHPVDCQSTLPDDFTGESTASDIHFSPDGTVLYAANRGYDSIVILSFDPETGKINRTGWVTEGIVFPRQFAIDPTGRWMLIANQQGNSVSVYEIGEDPASLTFTGEQVAISEPMCILF